MATMELLSRGGILALALVAAGCVNVTIAIPEALREPGRVAGEGITPDSDRSITTAAREGEYCVDRNGDPVPDGEWGEVVAESGKITMQLCLDGTFIDSDLEEESLELRRPGYRKLPTGGFVIDLELFPRVVRAVLADLRSKGKHPDQWYLLRHPGENQQFVRDGYRWEYRKGLWVRCRIAPQPAQQ